MKITLSNYKIRESHQDVLDIIGAIHSYSSRSHADSYAEYYTTSDLTNAQITSLNTLATDNGFNILIE